jgi:hypothetical protein
MASPKVHPLRYVQSSSLRRTSMYASLLGFCKPCIWSFLLCHGGELNLRGFLNWIPGAAGSGRQPFRLFWTKKAVDMAGLLRHISARDELVLFI